MKTINDIINEGSSNMKLWKTIDKLKEALGAEKLVDELCQSMSDDALSKSLEFICKGYEIDFKK